MKTTHTHTHSAADIVSGTLNDARLSDNIATITDLNTKADLNGDLSQNFSVKSATKNSHAVNKGQLDSEFTGRAVQPVITTLFNSPSGLERGNITLSQSLYNFDSIVTLASITSHDIKRFVCIIPTTYIANNETFNLIGDPAQSWYVKTNSGTFLPKQFTDSTTRPNIWKISGINYEIE